MRSAQEMILDVSQFGLVGGWWRRANRTKHLIPPLTPVTGVVIICNPIAILVSFCTISRFGFLLPLRKMAACL